jgi:5-methylcytosine-specific restriction endonuclease McrA
LRTTAQPGNKLWRNRARTLNERARMHRVEGHLTPGDLRKIVERDGSRCVYCQRELDYSTAGNGESNSASFDHVIRLVDGGSNTWENVVCACRGCNQRNANKSIADPQAAALERLRLFLARKAA